MGVGGTTFAGRFLLTCVYIKMFVLICSFQNQAIVIRNTLNVRLENNV